MKIKKIRINMPCGQVEKVDLGNSNLDKAIEDTINRLINLVRARNCIRD